MNMNELMQYVTYLVAAIGVMAFVVSVITQVIKKMPGLKNIPPQRWWWYLAWCFVRWRWWHS